MTLQALIGLAVARRVNVNGFEPLRALMVRAFRLDKPGSGGRGADASGPAGARPVAARAQIGPTELQRGATRLQDENPLLQRGATRLQDENPFAQRDATRLQDENPFAQGGPTPLQN
jgi:hypothetical protein